MIMFLLFLITILWGSTFIFMKILLDASLTPSFIILVRFSLSLLLFIIFFYRKIRLNKRLVINGTIIGVINAVGLAIQMIGLQYTTPAKSAFLTSSYMLVLPFLELFFWKNKISKYVFLGIFISLGGIYLLSFAGISHVDYNLGDIITIFCGFVYAIQIFVISHFTKEENTYGLVFMQFVTSSIAGLMYFVFMLLTKNEIPNWDIVFSKEVLYPLLFLSTAATFIPFTLQFYVQKYVPPTVAGVVYILEPVFTLFMSIIWFNEIFTLQKGWAVILIITGVLIVNYNNREMKRKS